jgi:hypothetical protein
MPGTSKRSTLVSFRLDNETFRRIQHAIDHGQGQAATVAEWCKIVITQRAWRHAGKKQEEN